MKELLVHEVVAQRLDCQCRRRPALDRSCRSLLQSVAHLIQFRGSGCTIVKRSKDVASRDRTHRTVFSNLMYAPHAASSGSQLIHRSKTPARARGYSPASPPYRHTYTTSLSILGKIVTARSSKFLAWLIFLSFISASVYRTHNCTFVASTSNARSNTDLARRYSFCSSSHCGIPHPVAHVDPVAADIVFELSSVCGLGIHGVLRDRRSAGLVG